MNVYLSLGSNLGDRRKTLRRALDLIANIDGVNLMAVSFFYETAPWGKIDQPNFINAAARINSTLDPIDLLDKLQAIETQLGRVRHERWGTRTIDIDILKIDDLIIQTDRLIVPHPLMDQRDFVKIPLADIVSNILVDRSTDDVVRTHGSPLDFQFKLIACVDRNWAIGYRGQLLFHIDEDMKRFRRLTSGGTIIMGRKTFDSLPIKPLPNRRNIVLTRSDRIVSSGVEFVNGIENLLDRLSTDQKNVIIGGSEIYSQLLPFTVAAAVTVVDEVCKADTFMNDLDARDDFIISSIDRRDRYEFRRYSRGCVCWQS